MTRNASTRSTCDISPLLHFYFWQSVCFNTHENSFPSKTAKLRGGFACASENSGHGVTCKILSTYTNKIIHRLGVLPTDKEESTNLRTDPLTTKDVTKACKDSYDSSSSPDDASTITFTLCKDPKPNDPHEAPSTASPITDSSDPAKRSFITNKDDR